MNLKNDREENWDASSSHGASKVNLVAPDPENPASKPEEVMIAEGTTTQHFLNYNDLTELEKEAKILLHFNRYELNDEWERPLLRSFYWSAFFGDLKAIENMVNSHLWSPFMKSFEKKDCLTAAIRGR